MGEKKARTRNTACGNEEQEVGQEQGSAYTGMQKSVVIETASSYMIS